MLPIVSYNGQIHDGRTPLISPFDRGFTLGDGVFETVKVHHHVGWYLERHLARLARGAARLGITVPAALRDWLQGMVEHVRRANVAEYVLRITVTRGVALSHGLRGSPEPEPTVLIAALEWPHLPTTLYDQGIRVQIGLVRRNERSITAGIKTTSYVESVLALRDTMEQGYDDVILLDTRDYVAEASASNVFLWRDGTLMTPSLSCGILPGITRQVVLELAKQSGFAVAEREIPRKELSFADELFLTSSLRGIVPVRQIDQRPVGWGEPGTRTLALMAHYAAMTERV